MRINNNCPNYQRRYRKNNESIIFLIPVQIASQQMLSESPEIRTSKFNLTVVASITSRMFLPTVAKIEAEISRMKCHVARPTITGTDITTKISRTVNIHLPRTRLRISLIVRIFARETRDISHVVRRQR